MEAEPLMPALTEQEMRSFAARSRQLNQQPLQVSKCKSCGEHTFSSDRRLPPTTCGRLRCMLKQGEIKPVE